MNKRMTVLSFMATLLLCSGVTSVFPMPPMQSSESDILGTGWIETESGWNGTWTRRGTSDVFDASWNGGVVRAVLVIHVVGVTVTIERRNSSDGNECNYQGTLTPDGREAGGSYSCTNGGRNVPWKATIVGAPMALPPDEDQSSVWLGFANEIGAHDRESELRQNCGADFKRVLVPHEAGNKFTDLCSYEGRVCERICDWQGNSLPCSAVSLGGRRDGTRIALCGPRVTTSGAPGIPDVSQNAPTPSATTIRAVDFLNFDYASDCWEQFDGFDKVIHASNGEWTKNDAGVFAVGKRGSKWMKSYGDLAGDGQEEAVIVTGCQGQANFGYNEVFVFTSSSAGPKLLARLSPTDWGKGEESNGGNFQVTGARVINKELEVSFFAGGSHVCAAWVVTARFKWMGGRLVRVSSDRKPNQCQ